MDTSVADFKFDSDFGNNLTNDDFCAFSNALETYPQIDTYLTSLHTTTQTIVNVVPFQHKRIRKIVCKTQAKEYDIAVLVSSPCNCNYGSKNKQYLAIKPNQENNKHHKMPKSLLKATSSTSSSSRYNPSIDLDHDAANVNTHNYNHNNINTTHVHPDLKDRSSHQVMTNPTISTTNCNNNNITESKHSHNDTGMENALLQSIFDVEVKGIVAVDDKNDDDDDDEKTSNMNSNATNISGGYDIDDVKHEKSASASQTPHPLLMISETQDCGVDAGCIGVKNVLKIISDDDSKGTDVDPEFKPIHVSIHDTNRVINDILSQMTNQVRMITLEPTQSGLARLFAQGMTHTLDGDRLNMKTLAL